MVDSVPFVSQVSASKRYAARSRREVVRRPVITFDPQKALQTLQARAEELHAAGEPAFRIAEQVCQEGLRYDLHLTYAQAMGIVIGAVENVARGERTPVPELPMVVNGG